MTTTTDQPAPVATPDAGLGAAARTHLGAAAGAELRAAAEETLRALAGPDARLRPDQWTAIEQLVAHHRRALVVQRTGWGKSAVYFVATALLRAAGAGPTVIVSPLLALMRNQVAAAERAGIRAASVDSTNAAAWERTFDAVDAGEVDVLLVSPERLNNPDFRDRVLPRLSSTCGLVVVDEAHCISDWGHDFRPDYRRLRTLLAELPTGIPVLATTATANERVTADVAEQLGTTRGDAPEVLVLRGGLDRESLHLSVVRLRDRPTQLAWLADRLARLPGSGIVYTLTVSAAQDVADYLRGRGLAVASYSGQTEQAERLAAEQDLLTNRVKALVATSALGMGFDKPDLGFVVHLGAPASPIAYYQQIGRAGRGVRRAEVVLLPGHDDQAVWDWFADQGFPPESTARATLAALDPDETTSTQVLQTRVDLSAKRLESMLKVLDVDGAVRRVRGGWLRRDAAWDYDADRYARVAAVRAAEQQAMRDYIATDRCRMAFLREQLDDGPAPDCGRCDTCHARGVGTDDGPLAGVAADAVSEEAARAASDALARPGVRIDPRRMWPTGMRSMGVPVSGKLGPGDLCEPGRVVARYTDLGFGPRVREVCTGPDGPAPRPLLDACVRTLAAWDWDVRPGSVVAVGSGSRPDLVASLARHLSEVGRLPLLGTVPHTGPGSTARSNSAQRLRTAWGTYRVPDELADAVAAAGDAPVLLVDDRSDTGWTAAVVGLLLRQAGAPAVLPFALGAAA